MSDAPLRLANLDGRAVALLGDVDAEGGEALDVAEASGGRFGPDPMDAIARWDELRSEWSGWSGAAPTPVTWAQLGPPVPRPPNVFAIGLNYRDHAAEAGLDVPTEPMVFTKFTNCLAGPDATVELSGAAVDWEVELVVVIGRGGRRIAVDDTLGRVAGYCVGQDLSDRIVQFSGAPPQFSMGKSFDGFGPIGPAVVDAAHVGDPRSLRLWCSIGDELLQDGTTADMVFGVAETVAYLSSVCTLRPGDLVFTGTPAGCGVGRSPARFLAPGDVLESGIERVGRITTRFCSPDPAP